MNKIKISSIENLALAGAVMVLAIVFGVVGFQTLGVWEKKLANEAVQGCMEIGAEEYTNPEQESKAITYNKQAFEACMDAKGY